jgi:hypothetical protein
LNRPVATTPLPEIKKTSSTVRLVTKSILVP